MGYQLKVSHNTANILRKYLKFKKVKKVSRPILSTSHIEQRLDFAKTNLRKQRLRRAYLDEKWFECFRDKKFSYRRKNSPLLFSSTPSRRFPPRIMFLSVVSMSVPTGKVGFWPLVEHNQFSRNSFHHNKGKKFYKE